MCPDFQLKVLSSQYTSRKGWIKIDIDIKVTLIAIQRNLIDSDGNFPTKDAAPIMDTARLLSDQTDHHNLIGKSLVPPVLTFTPFPPRFCEVTMISQVHH